MHALDPDPLLPIPPPGQDELPYDDGEPMESAKHRDQMTLLIETLQRHLADRPGVYIGGNMAVYFSALQARNNDFRAPDYFVVLDAIPDRERKSWVVWEEDGRTPDVVIELLSASTEAEDRGRKKRVYASLKVREYYLYDPLTEWIEGYRLEGSVLVPLQRRPDGDYDCVTLGLRLGVAEGVYHSHTGRYLRWKTADGALLATGDELEAVARARADTAEARAERLAARLRALGVDPEGA